MSVPKNFNHYGYIKYIAACDLFLKLADPLKTFIASKDGKKLTARMLPGFNRIHPRICAFYYPDGYAPRFFLALDTHGLEEKCPDIPQSLYAGDCVFFQYLYASIHKEKGGDWSKDRKHVYLIGGRIIADGWIAAIEEEETRVKKEKEECREILAAMEQKKAAG